MERLKADSFTGHLMEEVVYLETQVACGPIAGGTGLGCNWEKDEWINSLVGKTKGVCWVLAKFASLSAPSFPSKSVWLNVCWAGSTWLGIHFKTVNLWQDCHNSSTSFQSSTCCSGPVEVLHPFLFQMGRYWITPLYTYLESVCIAKKKEEISNLQAAIKAWSSATWLEGSCVTAKERLRGWSSPTTAPWVKVTPRQHGRCPHQIPWSHRWPG